MLKKIFNCLIIALLSFYWIQPTVALADVGSCTPNIDFNPKQLPENQQQVAITFTGALTNGTWYKMAVQTPSKVDVDSTYAQASDGSVTLYLQKGGVINNNTLDKGPHDAKLQSTTQVNGSNVPINWQDLCSGIHYNVGTSGSSCQLVLAGDQGPGQTAFATNQSFILRAEGAPAGTYKVCFNANEDDRGTELSNSYTVDNSGTGQQLTISPFTSTTYDKALLSLVPSKVGSDCTIPKFEKGTSADQHLCYQTINIIPPGEKTPVPPSPLPSATFYSFPVFISTPAKAGGEQLSGCTDNTSNPGIATAVGCIHTSLAGFTADFMKFVVGASGGFAFLMMILGAFQMLTSSGNPETLSAGRERLTSAIIGLLIVIFAVLLLQIIGVGFLNLPSFK